jgi:hypothetical protein
MGDEAPHVKTRDERRAERLSHFFSEETLMAKSRAPRAHIWEPEAPVEAEAPIDYAHELPRFLHKHGEADLRVNTPADCDAALADGWTFHPAAPAAAVPEGQSVAAAPAKPRKAKPATVTEVVKVDADVPSAAKAPPAKALKATRTKKKAR